MNGYQSGNKPTEEFRCAHCRSGAVEFEVCTTYKERTDEFGNPLSLGREMRPEKKVYCVQCGGAALVVQLDPRMAAYRQKTEPNVPQLMNQQFVEDRYGRPRSFTVNLNGQQQQPMNEQGFERTQSVMNIDPGDDRSGVVVSNIGVPVLKNWNGAF
jgi:hypothetical protein